MTRKICLFFLILSLFLVSVLYTPQNLHTSSASPVRGLESQFITSSDGDESASSIDVFEETLPDDVLFYPDGGFLNDTVNLASAGSYQGTGQTNTYTSTFVMDDTKWEVTNTTVTNSLVTMFMNFTIPSGTLEDVRVSLYICARDGAQGSVTINENLVSLYDSTDGWTDLSNVNTPSLGWVNFTNTNARYFDSSVVMLKVFINATDPTFSINLLCDYAEVKFSYMTLSSGNYAESFADVSDWTGSTLEATDSFTTDGDVLSFKYNWASASDADIIYTNSPSGVYPYIEVRYRYNTTAGSTISLRGSSADGMEGTWLYSLALTKTTTWTTLKAYWGTNTTPVECLFIYSVSTYSQQVNLQFDYIRASNSTSMGWQHDGSTTQGITPYSGSYSSDGENVTILTGNIDFDKEMGSTSYYPFLEININALSGYWLLAVWIGSTQYVIQSTSYSSGTFRYNIRSQASGEITRIRLYVGTNLSMYYIKLYSIANYTVTLTGTSTDDVLYVDSDILYCSGTGFTSMVLDRDPALSVANPTYNVWNVTTSSGTPQADYYVSAWAGYSSETRGGLTSGTLTDIRLKFTANANIAAITFIEDSTAPSILDRFATPANPSPSDAVTVSVVASDTVFIYKVTLNAVTYPAGFSDVDYTCTEQVAQNVYSYTFSTLVEGYYLFAITATDGANTDVDYLPVSTSTVPLQISDIVLITATEQTAQVSGRSNMDCSYQIYENDTLQGSGSVSSGWFSVAWTKDSTAGAYIELGIKFYVSTYVDWVNGSYSVATAEVLQITSPVYSSSDTRNSLAGYASLSCTWTSFDNNTQISTGSLAAGSFFIGWARQTLRGLHLWGVNFTDGVTTRWVNGSYQADGIQIVSATIGQDNDTIFVSGQVYSTILSLTYWVYENNGTGNVLIGTGTITLGQTKAWFSLAWDKSSENVAANFTLTISDGVNNSTVFGYYTKLDASITYIINATDIDNRDYTYEGDTTVQEDPQKFVNFVISIVAVIFLALFLGYLVNWSYEKRRKDRDFRAMVAGGH